MRVATIAAPSGADGDSSGQEDEDEEEANVDDAQILEDWPDETEVQSNLLYIMGFISMTCCAGN